ncbi:MAG: TorF family putative porin [Porticoccus sp.]|nr:TorF family putative porin [Porticoccus sp.]
MNTLKKALAVTSLVLTLPIIATTAQAFETSANVTLTTDYKFRGISQTDTSPAVQGGFDIAFDSGFYVGTWGSNVDFAKSLELDYYGGYAGDLTESLSFDVGVLYYDYPGTPTTDTGFESVDDDYAEIYGSLSFGDATLGFAYSDDYYLESGEFYYFYGDYSFALPYEVTLGLHYGFNSFDIDSDDSNAKDAAKAFLSDGEDSYSDYSITLGKSAYGLDFSLSWIDTDLDKDEYFGSSAVDSSVVFAISKSL